MTKAELEKRIIQIMSRELQLDMNNPEKGKQRVASKIMSLFERYYEKESAVTNYTLIVGRRNK